MSAYLVDRKHITYLIEAAEKYKAHIKRPEHHPVEERQYNYVNKFTHKEKELLGQMLWDENVRSLEGRYPDTRETRQYPGTVEAAEDVAYYVHPEKRIFNQEMDFSVAQVFKAIGCYNYQACEHEEFHQSDAFYFLYGLMKAVGEKQPGYSEAEWGAPEPWSVREPKVRAALKVVRK